MPPRAARGVPEWLPIAWSRASGAKWLETSRSISAPQTPSSTRGEGHRAQRADGDRPQHPNARGPGHGTGRVADDRSHPGLHRGGATPSTRGDHRLRHHRAHDPSAAAAVWRLPPQPSTRAHLRAVGHHERGASGREGGDASGRGIGGVSDRATDGGRDRRRALDPRAHRQHGGGRGRRHLRDRGHLARWCGGIRSHPLRRLRHRRRDPDLRATRARCRHR